MNNADKPAYPSVTDPEYVKGHEGWCFGLTKREYFAGLAMQGILSNPEVLKNPIWGNTEKAMDELTAACIEHADHLLKHLEK